MLSASRVMGGSTRWRGWPAGELAAPLPYRLTSCRRRPSRRRTRPRRRSLVLVGLVAFVLVALLGLAERRAEDVTERGAGVGRAVLGHRRLLVGDLQRLDRHRDLAAGLVDLGDLGIDLLADGEALRTLVGAFPGQVAAADEGGGLGPGNLDLDAVVLHRGHFAGHRGALAHALHRGHRIALELLDGEADALLLAIDVEHLGLHPVALLVVLDGFLAGALPVEVGQMHHAVHVAFQADEQAELGDVLDLALDLGARRVLGGERLPRIVHHLLEAERDAPLDRIDLEHLHGDLLRRRQDLAGMDVLLGPAHLGDVHQALDAVLELHEGAVVGDVGDPALDVAADRVLGLDALPRIALELLHAEADALGLGVDLDDLDLDRLADGQDVGGMVDALPRDVGDMQQAVDAAEIDEGAVIGDVLDHAVDDLALGQVLHQFRALLGAGLFHDGPARHHDVAAALVHLEDLEGLGHVEQRGDVADRANVDLAAGQERHGAAEIDREAALDAPEDHALGALAALIRGFQPRPGLLAPRLLARQHGLAQRVLDALEIDLDLVADPKLALAARRLELAQRHPPFRLQPDVDDRVIVLDGDDFALDHRAFGCSIGGEGFIEQGGEVIAAGVERTGFGHRSSF
jgi:hypothetical protein